MTCHPHRENPRRRVLNAIAALTGTVRVTGARGGLRIEGIERLTNRAVLQDLAREGLVTVDGIELDPPPFALTMTDAGRKAVEAHEEAHRLADIKARDASMAAAGAHAASDAGDVPAVFDPTRALSPESATVR